MLYLVYDFVSGKKYQWSLVLLDNLWLTYAHADFSAVFFDIQPEKCQPVMVK